jgi:hypothetical protein
LTSACSPGIGVTPTGSAARRDPHLRLRHDQTKHRARWAQPWSTSTEPAPIGQWADLPAET